MKTNIPDKYLAGCALAGAAIFLYLQQFIFPHLPVIPSGDQTVYLLDAQRMLAGQVLYRDFFQFLFPGTEFVYFALFKIFGVRAWVPAAALIFLGVGFVGTGVVISRRLLGGTSTILPGFLFLAIPFRNAPMNVASHQWYSTLAVMAALAVLINERNARRLTIGGALCGVGAWFNQTRGPAGLVGIVIFLLWESYQTKETWRSLLRRVVPLLGSFFATLVALCSYFIGKAGLRQFWYSTIIFLWKYAPQYPPNQWNQYGADMPFHDTWTSQGSWWVIELLVPYLYFLFFWTARRKRKIHPQEPWDGLMLVSIVGLCLFLSVAPSALNYRLCTVSLPALILLVWLGRSLGRFEWVGSRLLWMGLVALMIAETYNLQTRWRTTLDLPMGRVACFSRPDAEEFRWFLSHRRPSDFLLAPPPVNFPLGLANPTPLDFLSRSDFTRPEQVQSVIEGLETKHARWLDWGPFRGIPDGPGDHLKPLIDYLRGHYHVVEIFDYGRQTILERNEP